MTIEFRHVRKTYPDGTTAVEHFSVVIPSRSTTVLPTHVNAIRTGR